MTSANTEPTGVTAVPAARNEDLRVVRVWPQRGPAVFHRTPAPRRPVALRLPNLLIPGATKAGTSAAFDYLAQHPEICPATARDINHFAPLRFGRSVEQNLTEYSSFFDGWSGERYRFEAAPGYLDGGPDLISAVARDLPDVRVVILLRDPVPRLWSSYLNKVSNGRIPRAMTYDTFVDRCASLRASGSDHFEANLHFRSLSVGFYAEHVPAWLDTFGDRARIVFAEHLGVDSDASLHDLCRWLDLDPAALESSRLSPPAHPLAAPARVVGRLGHAVRSRRLAAPSRHGEGLAVRASASANARVRGLYAEPNRVLAAQLRGRGYSALPPWLAKA